MKKPKMVIIALLRGGVGHYVVQLSPYLETYFELEYISYKYGLRGDRVSLDDPVIIRQIRKKSIFAIEYNGWKECLKSFDESIKFIRAKKIDILNLHISAISRAACYYHIALIMVAKNLGLKILYTFHDVEPFEDFSGGEELLKTFYSLADGAAVGNEDEFKKLTSRYKFNSEKVEITRHGIYTIFDQKRYDKEKAKKHLGIPSGKKVVLGFGVLRPYKRFEDIIAAIPGVLRENPDAFLYISAGKIIFDNSKELISQAQKLGIIRNSKFIFDIVPSEEIEPIFKAADVVVLPYDKVSQSGILNLALAFKKPVVISNLFAESKEVEDKMGLVILPQKPDLIAKAVNRLISDSELSERFKINIENYLKKDIWIETAKKYKILANQIMENK